MREIGSHGEQVFSGMWGEHDATLSQWRSYYLCQCLQCQCKTLAKRLNYEADYALPPVNEEENGKLPVRLGDRFYT